MVLQELDKIEYKLTFGFGFNISISDNNYLVCTSYEEKKNLIYYYIFIYQLEHIKPINIIKLQLNNTFLLNHTKIKISNDGKMIVFSIFDYNKIGRLYIFTSDDCSSYETFYFDNPYQRFIGFGYSIAITSDKTIYIGCPKFNNTDGVILKLKINEFNEIEYDEILKPIMMLKNNFGNYLTLSKDDKLLLIGSSTNKNRGSVYIYDILNENYIVDLSDKIHPKYNSGFGCCIDINNDNSSIAISAPFYKDNFNTQLGITYIVKLIEGNWNNGKYIVTEIINTFKMTYFGYNFKFNDSFMFGIIGSYINLDKNYNNKGCVLYNDGELVFIKNIDNSFYEPNVTMNNNYIILSSIYSNNKHGCVKYLKII